MYNVQFINCIKIYLSRVHAVDTDCGVSSRVAYSFQDRQDQFEVNAATGDICLSSSLDYERLAAHHVTIVAVDRVSVLLFFCCCCFDYRVDKAYIAMKKIPSDVIKKGKK